MKNLVKELTPTVSNSIVQKIILATSGLVLIAFIIFHLLGNLLILSNTANVLNIYAGNLDRLGIVRRILEFLLSIAFAVHIFYAITIARNNSQARTEPYYHHPNRIDNSSQPSIFSRSMVYTGPLLLLFIIIHLKTLLFGAGISEGYMVEVDGRSIRDLERLVTETFARSLYVFFYVLMMIPLGFHLRHGMRSAGQSLGLNLHNDGLFDRVSLIIVIGISIGFAVIPIWIYWMGGK
jgi:succinate dehydrogenase / fumarate reductase, cytochrome b subunit